MAGQVISGTTYYKFRPSLWVTEDSGGNLVRLANVAVALKDNPGGSAIGTLTLAGSVWTPTTDANGRLPGFLAPQYDDVWGNAGGADEAVACTDIAEVIAGISAAASQGAQDILQPQIDALTAAIAGLGGGSQLTMDSLPREVVAAVRWNGSAWPARSSVTSQTDRVVVFFGNPGGTSPLDMQPLDAWVQG